MPVPLGIVSANQVIEKFERCSPGATNVGSCPTDVTPECRARRTVRALTAMMQLERIPHQSSRPLDPVEPLKPPCQKGCSEIMDPVP